MVTLQQHIGSLALLLASLKKEIKLIFWFLSKGKILTKNSQEFTQVTKNGQKKCPKIVICKKLCPFFGPFLAHYLYGLFHRNFNFAFMTETFFVQFLKLFSPPSLEKMHSFGGKNTEVIYSCDCCDLQTSRKDTYERHLLTRKHYENTAKVGPWRREDDKYICDKCGYLTNRRDLMQKHVASLKHMQQIQDTIIENPDANASSSSTNDSYNATMKILEFVERREEQARQREYELRQEIIRREDETRKLIIDICKNSQIINNTDNSINIQNNIQNNFNLNLFLNETCKHAVNMSEFIENVNIELDDMENYANNGFVEALSTVVIRNLEELGTERRPIHCTDLKRETIYIKENDKWEKGEEAKELFQIMLTRINKACGPVLNKWKDMHPTCVRSDSPFTNIYNNMICNIMGGDSDFGHTRNKILTVQEKENKVMSLIANSVVINKLK
jgi:hypothetical protein